MAKDFLLTVRVEADDREDAVRMAEQIEQHLGGNTTVEDIAQDIGQEED